jgi:phosphoribulokinase
MAERPSPYDHGFRHGVSDPSVIPDRVWNKHVKQKQEEDTKNRADVVQEISQQFAEADAGQAFQANSPMQAAINKAIASGVDRASVILTPEAKRLQSLGLVKLQDGTIVSRQYLERQEQEQQAQTNSDGFTDWAPYIDAEDALADVESEEYEDDDE